MENDFIEMAKEENIDEIFQLLNIVTKDLHEKGINQWTDEWKIEEIKEYILKQNIYIKRLEKNGKIIGIFSIEDNKLLLNQFPNSLYLSKIALLPEYQKKGIGAKMIKKAIEIIHSKGKKVVLDCWNGNHKLKNYYTNLGFKYITDLPEYNYYISVFSI